MSEGRAIARELAELGSRLADLSRLVEEGEELLLVRADAKAEFPSPRLPVVSRKIFERRLGLLRAEDKVEIWVVKVPGDARRYQLRRDGEVLAETDPGDHSSAQAWIAILRRGEVPPVQSSEPPQPDPPEEPVPAAEPEQLVLW